MTVGPWKDACTTHEFNQSVSSITFEFYALRVLGGSYLEVMGELLIGHEIEENPRQGRQGQKEDFLGQGGFRVLGPSSSFETGKTSSDKTGLRMFRSQSLSHP